MEYVRHILIVQTKIGSMIFITSHMTHNSPYVTLIQYDSFQVVNSHDEPLKVTAKIYYSAAHFSFLRFLSDFIVSEKKIKLHIVTRIRYCKYFINRRLNDNDNHLFYIEIKFKFSVSKQ